MKLNYNSGNNLIAAGGGMCHNGGMEREKTCCFTGHRAEKLPWGDDERAPACLRLKAAIADVLQSLYAAGYRHFLCGMATGADIYWGEAVAALREERPDVDSVYMEACTALG